MRYFLDTEFVDDGKTIDLISIGIVAEDGRTYYGQSSQFNHRHASVWVKENVFPHLVACPWAKRGDKTYHEGFGQCVDQYRGIVHTCPWRTRNQIRHDITTFLDPQVYGKPEIWGWCSGYDWVAFCQLFGTMMDLPTGYPHYMHDIQHILDERGITDDQLPADNHDGIAHNALVDARYICQLWSFLHEVKV